MRQLTLAAGFAAFALTVSGVAAHASPLVVTFNPGIAVPGAPTFQADKLNLLDYARADLSGTNFSESGYLQVNNVSVNNNVVNPTGNGSVYSLYLKYTAQGTQGASNFTSPSFGTITGLTYTLYEAAGPSTFGINGGNQAFVTNSGTTTALATGSLLSGTTSFTVSPLGAGANVDATFVQQLAGFIVSPTNATLTLHGAFNNDSQIVNVLPSGTGFTLNGGGGDLTFTATANPVPEPASLSLIGAGLIAVGALRKRRKAA